MITTPPIFTPVHEEEFDYLEPVSEETMRKLILNSNFLLDLAPVGTIIFVNINQPGVTQPNSNYWQVCDGSQITNPNSPIRSIGLNLRYTPNMKGLYPCGAEFVKVNNTGGTHIHNLVHGHTTGGASAHGKGLKKKGDRSRRNPHGHVLFDQYTAEYELVAPAYLYAVAYMKIV